MASTESKILTNLYTSMKERMMANPDMSLEDRRSLLELLHEPASEPTKVTYEEVQCPGTKRPAIWCKPFTTGKIESVILYLHGGGGFAGSPSSHRKLAGHLAKAAESLVLVTDYGLVPEQPFPEGLNDAVATYMWLVDVKGYEPHRIALAGDSAGGNVAVALGLKLKQLGARLPAAVAPFSPWLDMECTGESLTFNAEKEALTPPGMLNFISSMYLGQNTSPKDPLANPLYGDFKGYPPLFISVGGWEALLSDSTRLADRAREAGVEVKLEVAPEMQHVYHFMVGRAPEANKTISDVGNWLRERLSS